MFLKDREHRLELRHQVFRTEPVHFDEQVRLDARRKCQRVVAGVGRRQFHRIALHELER